MIDAVEVIYSGIFEAVISDPLLHGRWLNTLSYMENCGARKIAACENPTKVRLEMLKHAAEEFRHAYFLKSQIAKLSGVDLEDYSENHLLGGHSTLRYLQRLDVKISRLIRRSCLDESLFKIAAYTLVTYAIEVRADKLYGLYADALKKHSSKVTVRPILLEEQGHLEEMETAINNLPNGRNLAEKALLLEADLHHQWINRVRLELYHTDTLMQKAQ